MNEKWNPGVILDRGSQIPENHFMKWFREKIKENHINFIFKAGSERYLGDFIKAEDIKTWKFNTPVFISAQTGAGKNWFIQHSIIEPLCISNMKYQKAEKILLLSNRIAANRQSKLHLIDCVSQIVDKNYDEIKKLYTNEGIDKYLVDIGNVYVLSYKQFLERSISSEGFKYVVCDECHYFTSDAPFELKTNLILTKIVHEWRNCVRIYMSATPDVAFEPIIREEYSDIDQIIKKLEEIKQNLTSEPNDIDAIFAEINRQSDIKTFGPIYAAMNDIINQLKKYKKEGMLNGLIKNIGLNVLFYYMERNYDYIDNIFYYNDTKEITEYISSALSKNENEKWLVFVSGKSIGKYISQKLNDTANQNDVSKNSNSVSIYLDADLRKSGGKENQEFDYIVENEKFNSKVLVSTSTLDNGINIKDSCVKNIVIDVFDRTEFLQMLGRIRVEANSGKAANPKINLFVHKYTEDDLKKKFNRNITGLIQTLQLDTIPEDKRNEAYYNRADGSTEYAGSIPWFYNPKENKLDYNANAVYQNLSVTSSILSYLKNKEFSVNTNNLTGDMLAMRNRIHAYYLNEGKYKPWSRLLVDVIENDADLRERNRNRDADTMQGIPDRYKYVYDDTFTRYIYSILLPEFYKKRILSIIEEQFANNQDLRNSFDKWICAKNCQYVEPYEKIILFNQFLRLKGINPTDLSNPQMYNDKLNKYCNLSKCECFADTTHLQAYWLEKVDCEIKPLPLSNDECESIDYETERKSFYEEYLKHRIVSKCEIEKHRHKKKDGSESDKCLDSKYLDEHGIKKGSNEFYKTEKIYAQNIKVNERFIVTNTKQDCIVCSYQYPKDNSVYYILHPIKNDGQPAETN